MSCRFEILWYRDFYDVPRLFCIRVRDGYLLFDCPFDDSLDDYPQSYSITLVPTLPLMTEDSVLEAASSCSPRGDIPLADIHFDETRRAHVELPPYAGSF
jgi:hypothetical protein